MSAEVSLGADGAVVGRFGVAGVRPRGAERLAGLAGKVLVAAPVLALFSVLIQGFAYGEVNNAFQAPIVLGMPGWPQFRGDWFYQSLGAYSSALWPALAAFGPALGTRTAFLILHIVTRAATFAGFWLLLKRLGLDATQRWLACLVLATSVLMLAPTAVGLQVIFDDYFTQDAVAWALTVISWVLLSRGRFGAAVALTGPTFAVSAFTAVWNALALGVAGVADVVTTGGADGSRKLRQMLVKGAAGAAVALAVASPVIFWTVRTAMRSETASFDYAGFLWSYFPKHFFIAASSTSDVAGLAGLTMAGLVALWRLGAAARPLLWLFAGYALVFLLGVALPSLTHARLLLNLHLLRVDGSLQVLAALACVAVALGDLRRGPGLLARLCGALVLFEATLGLLTPGLLMALGVMAPLLLPRAAPSADPEARWAVFGALAVLAFAVTGAVAEVATQSDGEHRRTAEEQRVGGWLKAHTPVMARLLARPAVRPGLDGLQFFSERQVWVDWKRGAAVMWRPDLYPVWRRRMDEVTHLATLDQGARYACRNGLRYMVELTHDVGAHPPGQVVYRDDVLAVIDLAGACPAVAAPRAT